jgi:hypothetical protein
VARTHTHQLSKKVLVHIHSSYCSYYSYSSYSSVSHLIAPQSVSLVGAQIHCARTRTAHTRFCSATITSYARMFFGHRPSPTRQPTHVFWPEAIAARWSCGPHVTPASNRRRRCRAGVSRPPTPRALRRCAAYVATMPLTPYFQSLVLISHTCKFLVFFHPNPYYLCA